MEYSVEFQCGHSESVRDIQQKLAREKMAERFGYPLPISLQRCVWFTSTAALAGKLPDAVGLALHIDSKGRLLPVALEGGIEIAKPGGEQRKAETNVLVLLGPTGAISTWALADALPRYLHLVSNCTTIIVVERELGEAINRAFGWDFVLLPPAIDLPGFVALSGDGNPANSFCARAIAFGREAPGFDRYFIDSFDAPTGNHYTIVANDDARQLAVRAWENWEQNPAEKIVVEVAPALNVARANSAVADKKA